MSRMSFLLGVRLQNQAEQLQQTNAHLLSLSNTDTLTGLPNRRAFQDASTTAWDFAERTRTPLSLLMIDIDNFKALNDAAGHLEGDRCLVRVARAIDDARRVSDIAARFGGEEFVLSLPRTDRHQAFAAAKLVERGIAELQLLHPGVNARPIISVSIGVAEAEPGRAPTSTLCLVKDADDAMYTAKRGGRNTIVMGATHVERENRRNAAVHRAPDRAAEPGEIMANRRTA